MYHNQRNQANGIVYPVTLSAWNHRPASTSKVAAHRTHSWQGTRLQPLISRQVEAPLAAVKDARIEAALSGATCMAPYNAPQVPSGARPPPQAAIGSTRSSRPKAAHTVCAQLYIYGFWRKVASACSTRFICVNIVSNKSGFPEFSAGIRRNAAVSTGRKGDGADLGAIGHAAALELLLEEAAQKGFQGATYELL